jgi:hypothetical protein
VVGRANAFAKLSSVAALPNADVQENALSEGTSLAEKTKGVVEIALLAILPSPDELDAGVVLASTLAPYVLTGWMKLVLKCSSTLPKTQDLQADAGRETTSIVNTSSGAKDFSSASALLRTDEVDAGVFEGGMVSARLLVFLLGNDAIIP